MVMSPPSASVTPRVGFSELLPSGVHDTTHSVRKYLRRETDIPVEDYRQNPSQGRIAGRIVRTSASTKDIEISLSMKY